jgi:hypothetical protein
MADQRITDLVELPQGGVASNDVLPISDVSANQTKKIQVKALIQAGFDLADASTLDISKINQASAAKLGADAIGANVISYDKIQQVSNTDRLLGRSSAGAGNIEEITCTSFARSLLDDANATAARSTLSLGAVATGNTINTSLVEDLAITTDKIGDGAIITAKIADANVTSTKIASGAVDSAQLATSGVTQGKLAANSVITINVVDSGITQTKLAANAVTTINIADSGVTQNKLAADAIGTVNILDGAVTLAKMASESVGTTQLIASGITQEKLAANAVATVNLIASGITQSKLAADSVATINLVDSGVTAAKIASGAITIDKLSLSPGELTGAVITASSIPSGSYASSSIITADIADNAITFAKIQQVASGVLLGRASAGSGNVEAITLTEAGRALLDDADAAAQRTTLGLGSMADQAASGVVITGGTAVLSSGTIAYATINGGVISGITDLTIEDGGTGASTASGARTNLGLVIGIDVQAYDAALASIAGLTTASGQILYTTASDTYTTSSVTAAGLALLDDASASAQRTTLGLGSLAVQNTVASGNYDAGSIFTADIANSAITTAKILDSGVTTAKLVDSGVTTAKIVDAAITAGKIASDSVATAAVQDRAISFAKIQNTSQSNVIIGRATAGSGTLEEITCTAAARSVLDDATVEDIRATLGLGTLAIQNGTFSGTSTGTNTGDQTITLTGDVTGTGTGSFAATIGTGAVTEAKIADSAVTSNKVADNAITATALADQSASVVAAASPSASGAFIGQQWINTNNAVEYTWTGSEWLQQSALNAVTISGDTVYSFSTAYPDEYSAIVTSALNVQAANRVFVGPASGSDAAPTFRALIGSDLPTASTSAKGAVVAGAGLSMTGDAIGHTNSIASGTFYKVQVDAQGHVSSGATSLVAEDIPALDASKITTGFFGSGFIADDAIFASNLANYSTTKFGEALPSADFIGQYFFNPLSKDLYLWDGNVWNPVGISIGEIVFAGTYNASGNVIASVTGEGTAIGLSVGQPLPAASAIFNKYYVVVASGGTGISPAPTDVLQPPDIVLCNGSAWTHIDVSSTYVAQTATQVSFTPAGTIGSTNVQAAIEEVNAECRNLNNVASGILSPSFGGTGFASYAKGDLLAASGTVGFGRLSVGTNGRVLTANSATTTGLEWLVPASGTVLSVNATAPLAVVSGTTTPHITISGATTSAVGVVQLTDSTSTTSSTLAATATAVKSVADVANAALPLAGGTMTGTLSLGASVVVVFEGSIDDGFETTLTVANPTADRTITLPNVTGTVITTGDTGTVTNTMLAGSIADTKLDTISTAGKVSNSATTATSANTANAIIARDSSGNFSAGTIDATIDEGTF